MGRTETETIPCRVDPEKETDAAWHLTNQQGASAYFPKSQIHFERRNIKTGEAVAVIPVWLLEKKGWP